MPKYDPKYKPPKSYAQFNGDGTMTLIGEWAEKYGSPHVRLASFEARPRDARQGRFVLSLGNRTWHLTRSEVEHLLDACEGVLMLDDDRRKATLRQARQALGPGGKKIMRGIGRGIEALIPRKELKGAARGINYGTPGPLTDQHRRKR
jgi:hypothetical protein